MTAAEVTGGGERLRILGLSEGDHRKAMSGVAGHLFDALDRRCTVVQRLDYSPGGAKRLALAAACFRPSRDTWRARFHTSRLSHRVLSATLARRLEAAAPFDVALQVHGWVAGQPRPYALFIDQTRLMAERGWPSWIPLGRRERAEILALEGDMYTRAAHVFTMGVPARESLMADYDLDESRITVVGGGLNHDLPPLHEPSPEPTVLFIGRDFERKGGDCLLRAFELVHGELADAILHIVGVGRKFDRSGVISHGKLGREEVAALYRSARVFCMPSHYEPWGLVFPEAMSYGIPCVGSTVQSIPEILGHGEAGMLVAPDDPEGLAAALLELLTDDELAREVGRAGRQRVEQLHTWDHVADRMAPAMVRISGAVTA
jgi:glycosyltransferase involved in cell wall biosynthesis